MHGHGFNNSPHHNDGGTCALCSKNYVYNTGDICRYCQTDVDDAFFRIREYLEAHPRADALELSDQLMIDETIILYLIDTNRLEMVNSNLSRCSICGRSLIGMQICAQCRGDVSRSLDQARDALLSRGVSKPKLAKDLDAAQDLKRDTSRRSRQISTNYYKSMKK